MAKSATRTASVVRLFDDDLTPPDIDIDTTHLTGEAEEALPPAQGIDLTGKRTILLVVGPGGAGKTTLLRWACERAQDAGSELSLATIDPINRELRNYFSRVQEPGHGVNTSEWLGRFASWVIKQPNIHAAVDFGGGGEGALIELARQMPKLAQALTDEGLNPVLLICLTPRVTDLTSLQAIQDAGFWPEATGLVLNLGRADRGLRDFAPLRRHPAYVAARERGGVEIFLPRNFAADRVERRQLGFQAATKAVDDLDFLDRTNVAAWLAKTEHAFSGVSSWLP